MILNNEIIVNGCVREVVANHYDDYNAIVTNDGVLYFDTPTTGIEVFKNKVTGKFQSLPFTSH